MPAHGEHRQLKQSIIPFDTPQNMQLVLEAMQESGSVPKKYKSWEQLKEAYYSEIDKGLKPAAARRNLGIETRVNIFNKRQMRTMIPTMLERYITEKYGKDEWDQYRRYYKRSFEVEAKRDAKFLERTTGLVWDRGHPKSAKGGGPDYRVAAEEAKLNRRNNPGDDRAPEADRYPVGVMEDMGYPQTQLEGFYEWRLRNFGEKPRSGSVTGAGAARVIPAAADDGTIRPEQMEMTQSRAQQLEAQGVNVAQAIMAESPTMSTKNAVFESGDTTLTVDDASTLQQNGNGETAQHAGYSKEQWQDYSTQYQKPAPPKGWDFKNFSVRWTDNQLVIIDRNGRRMYNRFDGVVDRYDIFEAFLNDKVGHDAASGNYAQALGSAGQALAGNLLSVLDPNNATTTVAAGQLARAHPKLGIVMGAYSLAQGGVRFAQGWSAARDGLSWEEYQEQQIQNWLDEQERKEQERQLAASRAAVKNIKRQSKPTQLELDLAPNRGQLAATGF